MDKERNAIVIFDLAHDDTFLLEPATDVNALADAKDMAPDPRVIAVLSEILGTYGYRILRSEGHDKSNLEASPFQMTGDALMEALAIFEIFISLRYPEFTVERQRGKVVVNIFRSTILTRIDLINQLLPLESLIWDRDSGITQSELMSLGGSSSTAVAMRMILLTLPHAVIRIKPPRRARAIAAFRILCEVWDSVADDICAQTPIIP